MPTLEEHLNELEVSAVAVIGALEVFGMRHRFERQVYLSVATALDSAEHERRRGFLTELGFKALKPVRVYNDEWSATYTRGHVSITYNFKKIKTPEQRRAELLAELAQLDGETTTKTEEENN